MAEETPRPVRVVIVDCSDWRSETKAISSFYRQAGVMFARKNLDALSGVLNGGVFAGLNPPYHVILTHTMGLPSDGSAVVKHLKETIAGEHAEDGCSIDVYPNERPMPKTMA